MRKAILSIAILLVSSSVFAASLNLDSAIEKSFEKQNSSNSKQNSTLYSGKDIATANESLWSKQIDGLG